MSGFNLNDNTPIGVQVEQTLAQQTIKRVSDGLEAGEAAGLSEIVQLIQQLSSRAVDTSVQDLASLIGKDIVVTAKVIAAANTMGYNPTGVEVSTITQAIHVIGFNKIRQLAISLLLIENAERSLNANEKREIAALALCSGLMAESVMARHGTNSPEHAFICASLRNYGCILLTTFMLDEYRQAKAIAQEQHITEDQAFSGIFGLTPLELGHHLLACANLPEEILKSLRALPPDAIRQASQNPDVELLLLADLSVKMCELALRSDLPADEFEKRVHQLGMGAGRAFDLDIGGLLGVLRDTGTQLTAFSNTFGLNGLTSSLAPRIKARVNRQNPVGAAPLGGKQTPAETPNAPKVSAIPAPPSEPAPTSASETKSAGQSSPTSDPHQPAAIPIAPLGQSAPAEPEPALTGEALFQRAFDTGIERLAGLLDDAPIDMDKVLRVVLDASLQGFSTQQGVLFTRDNRSSATFSARFGKGSIFDAIRRQSLVRDSDRNVCGICLQRMEDVFINDSTDPKITPHLPSWLRDTQLASFVLLPLHEGKRPFGLLLTGWHEKKTIGFTVGQIRQVRSLLKLAGTAHRLSAR